MRELCRKIKRKVAALLVVVLALQTVLTSTVFGAAVPDPEDPNVVELGTGDPAEAFEYIFARAGETVMKDGDKLQMRFWFALDDNWIMEMAESYYAQGLLDLSQFEANPPSGYADYDDYLERQTDVELLRPSFTCTFNDGIFSVPEIKAVLESDPYIVANGVRYGTWSVADTAVGPEFTITLDKKIYGHLNIYADKSLEAQLLDKYEEGTSVEMGRGTGDVDATIDIRGEGTPTATDSNYTVTKKAEVGGMNAAGEDDPSAVNYTVSVRASASDAVPKSLASGANSEIATVSGLLRSSASASDTDDEIPLDERDGELLFDWWNLPVPVQPKLVKDAAVDSSFDLKGKYVTDSIPSNLCMDAVEVTFDGSTWTRLDVPDGFADWEAYLTARGRMFSWQIANEDDAPVQQVDVRFYTRISDELWKTYAEKGELHQNFPNTASLKAEDGKTRLQVSNTVDPEINWSHILEKNGAPLDVNGDEFKWTITADAHFTGGVQLYLVDHIEDIGNTHNYILGNSDKPVTIDGKPLEYGGMLTDADVSKAADSSFENLSINDIEAILGPERYQDGKLYTYEYTKENDSGAAITHAILLIPMKGYENGRSEIVYDTDITAAKKQGEDGYGYTVDVRNDVKPVWKWPAGGPGPGDVPFGGITVDKNYPIRADVVLKNAGNYDAATGEVTWEFEVNRRGLDLDSVEIVDPLDSHLLVWDQAGAASYDPIRLVRHSRVPSAESGGGAKTDRELRYVDPADYDPDDTGDFYTYDVTTDPDCPVLKFHIGAVLGEEYYKFEIKTKVLDPNYYQNEHSYVRNVATFTAVIGGQRSEPKDAAAEKLVDNVLIRKSVEPFGDGVDPYLYNYEDNTVQWKLIVNSAKRNITDAVVTDELPLGTAFVKMVSAKDSSGNTWDPSAWNQAEKTVKLGDVTVKLEETPGTATHPTVPEGPYSKDMLTFSFVDGEGKPMQISDTYEFVFTTVVEENFRKKVVKSVTKEPLVNVADLTGKIGGADIKGAHAEAVNEILPEPLKKEALYHGKDAAGNLQTYRYFYYDESGTLVSRDVEAVWFTWTAYVNRTSVDMANVQIFDTLPDCFELVPASMKIDKGTVDARGNYTADDAGTIVENGRQKDGVALLDKFEVTETGFSFGIPADYNIKTLRITFDAILVDDASAAQMVNKIHAKGDTWEDISGEARDESAADFTLEDYAHAEGMFYVRVLKSSSNHQGSNKLYLQGAKFSLTKMKQKTGNGDPTDINSWEPVASSKKERVSRSDGSLSFMFLQPDHMYKLEEVEAPVGYQKTNQSWYVVVNPEKLAEFPPEAEASTEKPVTVEYIDSGAHSLTEDIVNNPLVNAGNKLRLKKTGQNGQTLSGVTFRLRSASHYLRSETCDGNGVVEFENLDALAPGEYYTLTETTPYGYEKAKNYYVSVTFDSETKGYSVKLLDSQMKEITDKTDDPVDQSKQIYEIKNTAVQKNAVFTKVDQNGNPLTAEAVTFDIYRLGDGGKKESDGSFTMNMWPLPATDWKPYLPIPSVTSRNGIVTLPNLYGGYYKLTERAPEAGSVVMKAADPVYLEVSDGGVKTLGTDVEHNDTNANPANGNHYTVPANKAEDLKVVNELKYGYVQVNKALGSYDGTAWKPAQYEGGNIPIPDMLFGIYRRNAGVTETEPYMIVKTGTDGRFLMDSSDSARYQCFASDGSSEPGKVLVCGDYALKELSDGNGKYEIAFTEYPFTIPQGTTDGSGKYTPAATVYVDSEKPGTTSTENTTCFLNKPRRAPVVITKVDADYPDLKLNHAQFHVYVRENNTDYVVAELNNTAEAGQYALRPIADSGCSICTDGPKKTQGPGGNYLEKKPGAATGAADEYLLLPGTYIIKETKAPHIQKDDHLYPQKDSSGDLFWTGLEVESGGKIMLGAEGTLKVHAANTVENAVKTGSFNLTKDVQMLQQPVSGEINLDGTYAFNPKSGFTFTLTGTPAQAPAKQSGPHEKQTDTNGTLAFTDIPVGVYKMAETGVPEGYLIDPNGSQTDSDNWLVKKVPDTWVKIMPKDAESSDVVVKYYSSDACTAEKELGVNPGAEAAPADPSSIYKQGESGNAIAYNALKLANIEGKKQAVAAGFDNTFLAGAEFTLTHQTLKDANEKPYRFKTVSDADGSFSFKNVPYGTYTLEETGVPNGFKKAEKLTFTVEDKDVTAGVYKINSGTPLDDTLIQVNARFRKADQNGDAVPHSRLNAQFEVTKLNNSVAGDSYWFGDDKHKKTFYTDEDGILAIENLSCGVYEVRETLEDGELAKLDPAGRDSLVHFWLEVKQADGTAAGTVVSVYGENPAANAVVRLARAATGGGDPIAARTIADNGNPLGLTADFISGDGYAEVGKLMTNIFCYGGVGINKVGGDAKGDTGHEVTVPLAGVRFEIRKGEQRYLTLETNENGQFPAMTDGKYQDAESKTWKALLAGTYSIKEITGTAGYKTYTDPIEFTITNGDEVVYNHIGYDGETPTVATSANADAAQVKFYNVPERGSLTFEKQDADTGKQLDEAVFLVYTEEALTTPVAFVAQAGPGNPYQIIGGNRVQELKEAYAEEISGWSDTIDGVVAISTKDGKADSYCLKTGNYWLKEIRAPKDHRLPDAADNKIPVVIEADRTTAVTYGKVAGSEPPGVVANKVFMADLEFRKQIEKSGYRLDDKPENLKFVLKGTPSNASDPTALWTSGIVQAAADGTVSILKVPVGSYHLYEVDTAADTNTDQYVGFVPGTADEVALASVKVTAENGLVNVAYSQAEQSPVEFAQDNAAYVFTNKLKLGSVSGRKAASANPSAGLAGAEFGIYRSEADAKANNNPVATVKSGTGGLFRFENVAYGTYYIRERKAPVGYAPATTIFEVTVSKNLEEITQGKKVSDIPGDLENILFKNGNKRGAVTLTKKASPSNLPLTAAEFTVYAEYADGMCSRPVALLTHDDAGVYRLSRGAGLVFEIDGIPYLQEDDNDGSLLLIQGNYWAQETTVPDGYQPEMENGVRKVYPFTLSSEGEGQTIPTVTIFNGADGEGNSVLYNDIALGSFTIQKTVETSKPGVNEPGTDQAGKGFVFRIEGSSDAKMEGGGIKVSSIETLTVNGKTLAAAIAGGSAVIDGDAVKVTAGENGIIVIGGVPIGEYKVTETDGPDYELYTKAEPQNVTVSQNSGKTETEVSKDKLEFYNRLKRYDITGKKQDEKGAPLVDVVFGLCSADGLMQYDQAVTGADGRFLFADVPTGRYVVREISAPDDYVMDTTAYKVTVASSSDPEVEVKVNGGQPVINRLKHGFVEVEKTDPEDAGQIFRDVEFTVYAKDGSEITRLAKENGTNRYELASPSDGKPVPTDAKGDPYLVWDAGSSKTALIYGDYYLVETVTDEGYLPDLDEDGKPVRHEFSILADGTTVTVSNDGKGGFANHRVKGSFDVIKDKEIVGEHIFGKEVDKDAGGGFTFRISYRDVTKEGMFANADIRDFANVTGAASAEPGSGDSRWLEVTTDEDGRFTLSGLLEGEYTVAEVYKNPAADAWRLSEPQTITVSLNAKKNLAEAKDAEFLNRLKRGRIEGLKQTSGGKELEGAVIGLFGPDVTEFKEENLFYEKTAVSGADGKFVFENIPYGTYRVAELKAPRGYRLNENTSYLVTVAEDGAAVSTGIPEEKGAAVSAERSGIVIVNARKPGGSDGPDGPTVPTKPTDPAAPTEPTKPAEPTEPTEPESPTDESGTEEPELPEIPVTPEGRPDIPPDTIVDVHEPDDPEDSKYHGPYDPDIGFPDVEPGTYELVTLDDNEVPLGRLMITIDDEGVPLALPKTGDAGIPVALLAAALIGSAAGVVFLLRRREEDEE